MKHILKSLFILPLLLGATVTYAQNTVDGIIKDGTGLPVAGATVVLKGQSSVYAVADFDGLFSLESPKELPFTLVISSVGYKTQELDIYELSDTRLQITLSSDNVLDEVIVTSRRRKETAQTVPIPITVVSGALVQEAGAFNVNRVKELVPSVQLYSSNPRNTALNIRGLGLPFGLTNDGIEPGVGFYVDGVFYARPAATTLDFIDIEQIEVLRGPQGTLFGKNTTAGAFNVTTKRPSFTPGADFEVSYGNFGYVQAKASFTGPIAKNLAARASFSGTQRDGLLDNVATGNSVNDLNNLGLRGQLLYTPTERVNVLLAADITRQRPEGYAQVFAGVVQTQRPAFRQFEQIIADLNYTLPSRNPFDRVIDHDTPWRSNQDLGGISLNVDIDWGPGTLTATTAWRYWNWDPSNDRDFTGLPVLTLSQAPSRHDQWSQEIRYAGTFTPKLSGVFGVFAMGQDLKSDPVQTQESGAAQWRFSQNSTSELWQTPGLLEGFGINTRSKLNTFSGAIFGQLDWEIAEGFHILPGIRFNYDEKDVDFSRETFGGLQTDDPDLLAIKRAVLSDQAFTADVDDTNVSGQITASYKANKSVNAFATFATSFKSVGINLGGLPTSGGEPLLELAEIKPESVRHFEIGIKTNPTANSTLNLTLYNTSIDDFQTQVQTPELGVNRGFLANAEEVRVRGAELEGNIRFNQSFSLYGGLAYTDGEYVSFTNAPVPLEEVGGPVAFKDISGGDLPGISDWAGSLGGEYTTAGRFFGLKGTYFLAVDNFFRSSFSSSASPSQFLNIDGYALVNSRLGFRGADGFSVNVWARNLFDKDYFEQLLPAGGSAGHFAAVLGDQRTVGITLRYSL
ncbi:TonB-dependent receptor [Arenibacter sp. GZD96]|uniref:TonB-dependent receptor n=1 Tax=Aurantibrevibacter litoralis TaxID=3106030 RepID=UPI002AFF389F|nr:TonB-dependent receptor [Arenibacter sp. GZD-96]MEA1786591.1 TonB-dependent receptor [Arenibacter sp. GZD-96]